MPLVEFLQATIMTSLQSPALQAFMKSDSLHRPVQREQFSLQECKFPSSQIKTVFENRCVLFIFVDESTFEHFSYEIFLPLLICQHIIIPTMNFPESVNNCWIYPFILLKLCLQWLAFVQHFLPFVRKFQQQAMFKFYHFNNIQPPVQRKCRKITSQNQWISLCRGSQ